MYSTKFWIHICIKFKHTVSALKKYYFSYTPSSNVKCVVFWCLAQTNSFHWLYIFWLLKHQHCPPFVQIKGVFTGSSESLSGISCADCLWMVPRCHSVPPPPQSPQSCLPLQHWDYGAPPKQTGVSLTGYRQAIGQISHIYVNVSTQK